MDNIKVIDADTLMKIGMRGYKEIASVNWHGIIIQVRYMISREEESELIASTLRCCFNVDKECFVPELVDLAYKSNVVSSFAFVSLPNSIDDQYKLLCHSNLFESISSVINQNQLNTIKSSIYGYVT